MNEKLVKKKKISVNRLLKIMNATSEDHILWEVNLIKKLDEKNFVFMQKNLKNNRELFLVKNENKSSVLELNDENIKEIEFSNNGIKEATKDLLLLANVKGCMSLATLSNIKDDNELMFLYLNNPYLLDTHKINKIDVDDFISGKCEFILKGVASKYEEKKPLFFNTPRDRELIHLFIDCQKDKDFKFFDDCSESMLAVLFNEIYSEKAFYFEEAYGNILYKNNKELALKSLTERMLSRVEHGDYTLALKVLNAFAQTESEHVYPLSEFFNFFNETILKIARMDKNIRDDFLQELKTTTKAYALYMSSEKILNGTLLNDDDLSITTERCIKVNLDKINKELFKNINDDLYNNLGNDNFMVSIEDSILEIKYRVDLRNLTDKEIVHEVIYFLVNPQDLPDDLEKYFKEINLRNKLVKKDDDVQVRAKI